MDAETKELVGQLGAEFRGEFQKALAESEAEVKKLGSETAETKQLIERMQDSLDAMELKLRDKTEARPEADPDAKIDGSPTAAFKQWVKTGSTKGLVVSDDSDGGFIAPPEVMTAIQSGIVEVSLLRGVAEVVTTGNRSIQRPKRTGLASASWIGEVETRSETTNPSLGLDEIPTHEMYARVYISQADLDDTKFDLEGWVKSQAVEQFGVLEGNAFVLGNGVKKPEGILTNADIATVNSGSAGAFTYDGLVNLAYSLKTPYAGNARFAFNRLSIRDIRKLKDSTNQPLWAPMTTGAPASVLGYPYFELPDMPVPASAAKAAIFGDFSNGYTIVDRIAIRSIRDELTAANIGQVVVHMYSRVGGQVNIAEALKVQVLS